jgi:secretion/DNA translocation related TadE-like protein
VTPAAVTPAAVIPAAVIPAAVIPAAVIPAAVIPAAVIPAQDIGGGRSSENGSVTVIMLAVIAAVLMLTVSGLFLTSAVLASHRARAAADLAALAAAGALMRGEAPAAACILAAHVAAANHGRVQRCTAVGTEVVVSISVPMSMNGLAATRGLDVATARSRAGPGIRKD